MTAAEPRITGLGLLLAGATLMWIAWRTRHASGFGTVEAAAVGPLSAILGVGLLVHGARLPRYGMSRHTRVYGMLGGLAGAAYLWLVSSAAVGSTGRARWLLPAVLTAIWLIPVPSERGRSSQPP